MFKISQIKFLRTSRLKTAGFSKKFDKILRGSKMFGPPLCCTGYIVTSYAVGTCSIPGRVDWGFVRGFLSITRQMSENLGHIRPRLSYGHPKPSKPYIIRLLTAIVSDLSCSRWSLLNNKKITNVCINFWSVNFFRRTMHSKSPVVNLAELSWNAFGKQVSSSVQQSIVTDI